MAAELAYVEGKGIVLAQVIIHAVSRGIVHIDACLDMLLRDDVDDACHRIAAVQGTLRTLDYLDALDVVRVNQSEVVLASHVAVQTFTVHQDEDVGVAQTAQLHLAAHIALVEGKRCRQRTKYLLDALAAKAVQHFAIDDLGLHGHIL